MALDLITQYIINLVIFLFGGFEAKMINIIIYTFGMAIYGVVIWNYYHHLAKRDIFKIDFSKYRRDTGKYVWLKEFFDAFFYVLEYLIIFPFFSFLWFSMLSLFLIFLAKASTVEEVLLVSMSIVAAVRITSYYNEDLSKDLAKLIPFVLLGVFLVEPNFFSMVVVWEKLMSIPLFVGLIGRYLLFVILLEFALRMMHWFFIFLRSFFYSEREPDMAIAVLSARPQEKAKK